MKNNYHTIMFLVWRLNIITCRYDSFLFNYHATIINQQFNHHFSRFTRNRYTPKVLKTECFQESISLFCRNTLLFYKKDVRFFPQNARIRAIHDGMIVEKTSIMPTIIPHKYWYSYYKKQSMIVWQLFSQSIISL